MECSEEKLLGEVWEELDGSKSEVDWMIAYFIHLLNIPVIKKQNLKNKKDIGTEIEKSVRIYKNNK